MWPKEWVSQAGKATSTNVLSGECAWCRRGGPCNQVNRGQVSRGPRCWLGGRPGGGLSAGAHRTGALRGGFMKTEDGESRHGEFDSFLFLSFALFFIQIYDINLGEKS